MIIYNRSMLFIFNSLRINGVVECRNNYIRNRDIRGFYVIMGSGMSNIKTDILIETTVYIEISNKILDPHLKYG